MWIKEKFNLRVLLSICVQPQNFVWFLVNFSVALLIKVLLIKKSVYYRKIKMIWDYTFFYKQLGSDLNSQSCLYFQRFRGSELLNGCLIIWPSNLCEEYNNFQNSRSMYLITDFKVFQIMLLRQLNFTVFSI